MWVFIEASAVNSMSQTGQLNNFSFVWVKMWTFNPFLEIQSAKHTFVLTSTVVYSLYVFSKPITMYVTFTTQSTWYSNLCWLVTWQVTFQPRLGEKGFFANSTQLCFYFQMFSDVSVKCFFICKDLFTHITISQRL